MRLSLSVFVVQVRQSLVVGKQQAEKVKFDPVPVIENEFERAARMSVSVKKTEQQQQGQGTGRKRASAAGVKSPSPEP